VRRTLAAALACAAVMSAHAAPVSYTTKGSIVLSCDGAEVSRHTVETEMSERALKYAVDHGGKASCTAKYPDKTIVFDIPLTVAPPPPTCPAPPSSTTRTQDCPAGSTGTWTQTSTSTVGPAPECAVSTTWSPSSPPAGACNRAPTITGTPVAAVQAGSAYSFTPVAADPDGDTLGFTIANRPTWASFDPATGRLSGTPGTANVGISSSIVITVSDGKASAATSAFSVTVTAPPPPPLTAPTNLTGTATPNPTNPTNSNVKLTWDAVAGATSYSVERCQVMSTGCNFVVLGGPTSATYTNSNLSPGPTYRYRVQAYTPSPPGPYSGVFDVTIPTQPAPANRAPTIAGTPATSVISGQAYLFQPTAADADGDALTYAIQNKPTWASFTNTDGRVWGTPALADVGTSANIQVSVTDGKETTALPTFSVTVTAQPTGSVALNWTPPTLNTDGSAITNLAGYRIYYGTSATVLSRTLQVNNAGVSSFVVDGLVPSPWYFAVTAISTVGAESPQSNITTKTVQ
jgi:hypothetical protein